MVISCSSYGCINRRQKGSGIQFHRFPLKRSSVLAKWINEMIRKTFKPTEYSYLCSEHFTNDDCQIRPESNVRWVKDEAVPSIFKEFPKHLQKKKVVRRLLQRHPLVDNNCDTSVDTVDTECSSANMVPYMDLTKSSESIENNSKSVQCSIQSPTKAILRKKVKVFQQLLTRRELK